MIVSELDRSITIESAKIIHQNRFALVGLVPAENHDLRSTFLQEGVEAMQRVLHKLQPWVKIDLKKETETQAQEMSKAYAQAFGSPADPEYKKEMDRLIEELKSRKRNVVIEQEKQEKLREDLLNRNLQRRR